MSNFERGRQEDDREISRRLFSWEPFSFATFVHLGSSVKFSRPRECVIKDLDVALRFSQWNHSENSHLFEMKQLVIPVKVD